jgi:AcrR family transcriptional regulator
LNEAQRIKTHILNTTATMLQQGFELEALTIRKIAQKANISTGLIHYHFGSKDSLLVEAVEQLIDKTATLEAFKMMDPALDAKIRLRQFLMALSHEVLQYNHYSKILLKHELLSNSFDTPRFILPLLKEIAPDLSKQALKWLSIQVVAPLQYIFMKEEGFLTYYDSAVLDIENLTETHLRRLGL